LNIKFLITKNNIKSILTFSHISGQDIKENSATIKNGTKTSAAQIAHLFFSTQKPTP
jgi:hypothetical protein